MNTRQLKDRLFELEYKCPHHQFNPEALHKRYKQLVPGVSRPCPGLIIDHDALAKCVRLQLLRNELRHLQIEIEALEKELAVLDIIT
jgi:hypothetical protein